MLEDAVFKCVVLVYSVYILKKIAQIQRSVLLTVTMFANATLSLFCLSGPSLALCLAREDAVQVWRDLLGPKDVNAVTDENPEE